MPTQFADAYMRHKGNISQPRFSAIKIQWQFGYTCVNFLSKIGHKTPAATAVQYQCYPSTVRCHYNMVNFLLTHWGRVTHICVSKLFIIGWDNGLSVAWTAPSHYLKQCWNIVNWTLRNKLQWKFNRNSNISSKKMHLKMASAKLLSFCLRLNVLNLYHRHPIAHP